MKFSLDTPRGYSPDFSSAEQAVEYIASQSASSVEYILREKDSAARGARTRLIEAIQNQVRSRINRVVRIQ